jgi:hypothetical protein
MYKWVFIKKINIFIYSILTHHIHIRGLAIEESYQHLLQSLEVNGRLPSAIDYESFHNYFADFSAGTNSDDYFESVIKSLF